MISLQSSSPLHNCRLQIQIPLCVQSLFIWSQFSLWRFYCLFGYINSSVRLKWLHTNCIWLGRALINTQRHKHTNWLREVSLVKSEALQFHSNITGTTEPVNLLFSHTGETVSQPAAEWCVSAQSHLYLSDFLWPSPCLCSSQWAHFYSLHLATSGFHCSINRHFHFTLH